LETEDAPDRVGNAECDWHVRAGLELRDMIDARMYPTVNYALSHDKASTRTVNGGTVTYDHGRVRAVEAVCTA